MTNIANLHQQQQAKKDRQRTFSFITGVGIVRTTTLRNLPENAMSFGTIVKGAIQQDRKASNAPSTDATTELKLESKQMSVVSEQSDELSPRKTKDENTQEDAAD